MEVLTLVCTQVPVIGALIWFLIYFTKRVDARDIQRENWFIQCLADKDEIFKTAISEIVSCHNNANAKTLQALSKLKSGIRQIKSSLGMQQSGIVNARSGSDRQMDTTTVLPPKSD